MDCIETSTAASKGDGIKSNLTNHAVFARFGYPFREMDRFGLVSGGTPRLKGRWECAVIFYVTNHFRNETSLGHGTFGTYPDTHGTDFESLQVAFARHLQYSRLEPEQPGQSFDWRAEFATAGGFSAWRIECNADYSTVFRDSPQGCGITFPIAGSFECRVNKGATVISPGMAVFSTAQLLRSKAHAANGRHARATLLFNPAFAAEIFASQYDGASLARVAVHHRFELTEASVQPLYLGAQTVISGLFDAELPKRSPKVMNLLAEAILRMAFENAPIDIGNRKLLQSIGVSRNKTKTAIDFMHANLHLPLTITDIANSVGVSIRSLQDGFRRLEDTTPTAYLHQIRLEAAHAELARPENELPINEVAPKWGFTHMGRFSAQYRAAHGEHPSQTVRRAHSKR